ncbi:hypothetical protein [Amycolatopsis sp. BJA-103]|uniref:hypothetical protein n=1 Tax=Amycolatopsis sp. BJA-103 TaxID=1911175 RepID=UPI000CA103DD|nr:hypothetical protein [Amycolatopsis sp. BJA-103]AUI59580.1 hypothetical protein BKN51_16025 [Amycolatopsis sp. BJA-103]PNE16972.1 hypothetical protein B1H26_18490 [Amycolatopsis sp. BJA-103]
MTDSQIPHVLGDLSTAEDSIIHCARRGTWFHPDPSIGVEQLETTDFPHLRVRARLLRELLMGRHGELDPRGVLVEGMRVVGRLDLNDVTAITRLSLVACALPDGITCVNARLRGLLLRASQIRNLNAQGLRCDGDLLLHLAMITGTSDSGALRLHSAHVDGMLNLERSTITSNVGPALNAEKLRTGSNLFLLNANITGAGESGALRLHSAHIDGLLELDGSTVTNSSGPALHGENLRADNGLFLRDVVVAGAGDAGALRLHSAQVGSFDGTRAVVANNTGAGLTADMISVDGSLILRDATITGAGELGALRLAAAHIGSQAVLLGVQLTNKSGPVLLLNEARVDGTLYLSAAAVCPQARSEIRKEPCPDNVREVDVQGLVFPRLGGSWREWLHLLVHHTVDYRPQPYQQLATVERTAGHDNNARHILITQQDDLRHRSPDALGKPIARWRHWLWGWLGRYGYRAHRLVIALAATLILTGAIGYTAGHITTRPHHYAAERVQSPTIPSTQPGTACSTAELIGLGIDRGLPLGATGLRARCDLDTATGWGQTFTYLLWTLQALLWALATLTIAAYTGLVRKPT